jgi:putative transposase
MARHPFRIVASVILPDHMHFIWTLPTDSSDYSTCWRLIKTHFTRNWRRRKTQNSSNSLESNPCKNVWQPRFWEHLIRDENDLTRHIDYIHFNPVKHGYADSPFKWDISSFAGYVQKGMYQQNWGELEVVWDGEKWME